MSKAKCTRKIRSNGKSVDEQLGLRMTYVWRDYKGIQTESHNFFLEKIYLFSVRKLLFKIFVLGPSCQLEWILSVSIFDCNLRFNGICSMILQYFDIDHIENASRGTR